VQVLSLEPLIAATQVMVCQLEVRPETTLAALRLGKSKGLVTIFNPAPAPPSLDPEFYTLTDIFCVNETEAETLSGVVLLRSAARGCVCIVAYSEHSVVRACFRRESCWNSWGQRGIQSVL
jgi:sugar/nucleoside kinase (ribokinase family)